MGMNALNVLSRAIMTVAPNVTLADLQVWMDALENDLRSSGVITPNRLAAFLSQVAYESAYFTRLEEDLSYSAARLCEEWPDHFHDLAVAEFYAGQPEKLANLVYGGRFGNGPPESGDGWLYRGRGLIQLTFLDNYTACGTALKMPPAKLAEIAATPPGAAQTACWFWTSRRLNALADGWNIEEITRRVQGSTTTAPARLALAEKTRAAIQVALAAA